MRARCGPWRNRRTSGNPLARTDMAVGHRGHEARISVGQATTTRQSTSAKSSLPAPMAPRRPHSFTVHGVSIVDDYAWLKDKNWQEVLRDPSVLNGDIRGYLGAENDYTESLLGHSADLQKTLVAAMRGRLQEADVSMPARDGPFTYMR